MSILSIFLPFVGSLISILCKKTKDYFDKLQNSLLSKLFYKNNRIATPSNIVIVLAGASM